MASFRLSTANHLYGSLTPSASPCLKYPCAYMSSAKPKSPTLRSPFESNLRELNCNWLWTEYVMMRDASASRYCVHSCMKHVRPFQCLTCSSWQPGLDGRICAEQDTPFQELSDDTSSTAASSQLTPKSTRHNLKYVFLMKNKRFAMAN